MVPLPPPPPPLRPCFFFYEKKRQKSARYKRVGSDRLHPSSPPLPPPSSLLPLPLRALCRHRRRRHHHTTTHHHHRHCGSSSIDSALLRAGVCRPKQPPSEAALGRAGLSSEGVGQTPHQLGEALAAGLSPAVPPVVAAWEQPKPSTSPSAPRCALRRERCCFTIVSSICGIAVHPAGDRGSPGHSPEELGGVGLSGRSRA